MLAIDTNVVIRYLVADEPVQAGKARRLIDNNAIFVGTTVILETEWVLRSVYGFSNQQSAEALTGFAGLPNVTVEEPAALATALGWLRQGLDFADGLHLAKAEGCDAFISFDREFAKAANGPGAVKVRVP